METVKDNQLYFDKINTVDLAKEFGTPLYLFSRTGIVAKLDEIKECFIKPYPKNRIAYAAKAFFTVAMGKILQEEDVCVDVVSGGELYTAIKSGFNPEKIEFNGNNKSRKEIQMAVEYKIGRIIVDSPQELAIIEDLCRENNTTMQILYRITPGVVSDTHDFVVTGKKDSKFGLPLDEDIIIPHIKSAIDSPYVNLLGLHFHIGSQILDNSSHLQAVDIMLSLVKTVREKLDYNFKELNIGGGFGIRYTDEEPEPFSYFLNPMMKKIEEFYKKENLELPAIVVEPGRSIVGDNGITLYTVGSIKDIPEIRKYVSVDGGMGDNIRPALYGAKYSAIVANKADMPKTETVTISGKYCESGDVLIKDITLPKIDSGDILAVFSTGAYGYSMANNYNKNPIPGAVLIQDGKAYWMIKPQSYDDIIRNEVVPEPLT